MAAPYFFGCAEGIFSVGIKIIFITPPAWLVAILNAINEDTWHNAKLEREPAHTLDFSFNSS